MYIYLIARFHFFILSWILTYFQHKKQSHFYLGMLSNADAEFAWSQWATITFFVPLHGRYISVIERETLFSLVDVSSFPFPKMQTKFAMLH